SVSSVCPVDWSAAGSAESATAHPPHRPPTTPPSRSAETTKPQPPRGLGMKDALLEKMAGEITLSQAPGATLRKWRETFQFNQSELAARLEVNPSVVSDYESGRRKSPGIATVKRLVEALV